MLIGWQAGFHNIISRDLQFLDHHEAEQPVQPVEAEGPQGVLYLREQTVVGHLLVGLQVVPGVQLVHVTRRPGKHRLQVKTLHEDILKALSREYTPPSQKKQTSSTMFTPCY